MRASGNNADAPLDASRVAMTIMVGCTRVQHVSAIFVWT